MELATRLEDPKFRAEVPVLTLSPSLEEHQELIVLRLMEMIGTYVKHGLLDAEIVFDYWIPAVVNVWERLEALGIIAMHRETLGPHMWENFEDLYRRGRLWMLEPRATNATARVPVAPSRLPVRDEVVADASGT